MLTITGLPLANANLHKFSAALDALMKAFPKTKKAGKFVVLQYPMKNKKESAGLNHTLNN